jgi:hypothetical protein
LDCFFAAFAEEMPPATCEPTAMAARPMVIGSHIVSLLFLGAEVDEGLTVDQRGVVKLKASGSHPLDARGVASMNDVVKLRVVLLKLSHKIRCGPKKALGDFLDTRAAQHPDDSILARSLVLRGDSVQGNGSIVPLLADGEASGREGKGKRHNLLWTAPRSCLHFRPIRLTEARLEIVRVRQRCGPYDHRGLFLRWR